MLTAREPVHVVSQRLGHTSAVVTMTVYAHVLPGSQREAANRFARPGRGCRMTPRAPQASDWHHGRPGAGVTRRSRAQMPCGRGDSNPHGVATNRT